MSAASDFSKNKLDAAANLTALSRRAAYCKACILVFPGFAG